jgi:chromate reductase
MPWNSKAVVSYVLRNLSLINLISEETFFSDLCSHRMIITLISGTNRTNSLTHRFAAIYGEMLREQGAEVRFLPLTELPTEILLPEVYEKDQKPRQVLELQEQYFIQAEKFVFIFPEYNGSIPGVLKLLIDGLDPKLSFKGKKASMIGLATGRAGNLRGLDHLSSILQHMQVTVMPYLLPVSRVQAEFAGDNGFSENTQKVVQDHVLRTINM